MNPQWQEFLITRGAEISPDSGVRFAGPGNAPLGEPGDCALFDLSHLGLIAVRGEDAESYLQGQLTNDIRELSPTHSQLSSHCSPKGRMLANFRVLRLGDTIYLQLPRERVPDSLKRLKLYVLRAKVTLEDASDTLVRIGIAGECAASALARLGLGIPDREEDLATTNGVSVLRLPSPAPRFELIGEVALLTELWDGLAQVAVPSDRDLWALHDIRAGIPHVFQETVEAFVPQMVNMQLIDGVSFTKGCYTGQEVVARMQYLGKLKRRMYWAEVESDAPPRPGDELHAPTSTSEQASGRVVDARPAGPGRCELLAVVEIEAAEGGEVRLGGQGPLLRLRPPPYGFPQG
ncbi:MAG: YgfZ/GcvT domain-containing protein [Bdellovibrio bacteriovorus]